ncbi:transcriptional regulator [bacterium (Candidatus Gribaldobacteria) CG10_big_fil_rev_8_21_14_0_10_33_41]|nr:MAG: transcriptional regulator [bacterium (Candidatus Gribaldobacteria) CG10_big_fil_rev_8_21_14_0_10_33_41]
MANKIKFLDLSSQYKSIKKEIDKAIKRVLESNQFIGGDEVKEFEKEIAKFCSTKYALSVNSGTDALFLSLKALGIGLRDEVITTPFTFISTAEVIANCNAKPVFVDIDPKTFNINPLKIEEKINKKTKAIIPVHLFGQMADMTRIMRIARKYGLYVIEDAAQAIGAEYKNKKAGTFSDLGCFSFFPSKNLGGYGDGGMVVSNNEELAEKIRLLKNHGSSPKEKYLNLILGTNSRLDTIQAAILRVKLKHLEEWSKARAKKAGLYTNQLGKLKELITPSIASGRTHIFHQYTVRVNKQVRNKLVSYLNKQGIPTMIYYPVPLHLQPAFKYLGYKKGDFPEAEKASEEVISLPIYPELNKNDQNFIIKKIRTCLAKEFLL